METHNLDINMYSLKEVLDLYDLDFEMNLEDLKNAKRKLAKIHPDKSKLPEKYFIFYKQAFDIILTFCREQTKVKQEVGFEKREYETYNSISNESKKQVTQEIKKMNPKEFQEKFNKLFDENMSVKKDTSKYDWFSQEENQYEEQEHINQANMGMVFEKMKSNQQDIVKYKGVQEINTNVNNNLYDDDENDEYVICDPFSKLKFDDLRKVHKDETIFSVSENDIHKKTLHNSVESLNRERSVGLTPMQKANAEDLLRDNQLKYQHKIMEKQYTSTLQNKQFEEKNKTILSQFLRLKN